MRHDFSKILEKLKTFDTNMEKYEYLLSCKADLEREIASIHTFDLPELKKLKVQTEKEYNEYMKAPYRIQPNNNTPLSRRLTIESKLLLFNSRVKQFDIEIHKLEKLLSMERSNDRKNQELNSEKEPFYSYYYADETKESIYQLKVIKRQYSTGQIIHPTNQELFVHLCMLLLDNVDPLFNINECLNYQYAKCQLPKKDFIKYTKRMYLDHLSMRKKPLSALDQDIHAEIMDWFEKRKPLIDVYFIQGERKESYNGIRFEVEKEGEVRTYDPYHFLDLILEGHCVAADETENLNEKIECLINAEFMLKTYILRYNLESTGTDFSKIFQHLNNSLDHFKKKKELKIETTLPNIIKESITENDVLLSTIEDWLFSFKVEKIISDADYEILVSALKTYFETGAFPDLSKSIKIGKVNKKRFGWALSQIYRSEKSDTLSKEYLLFAKENISLFSGLDFDEADIFNSKIYKYFTTKTK